MVDVRTVTKELIGLEDILTGAGTVNQTRNDTLVPITKLNAGNISYDGGESVRDKLAKKFEVITSIANLRLFDTSTEAERYVNLTGHTAIADGGEGLFYWDADSTETDNNGTIVKVTAIAIGRWKRNLILGTVNVKWFGAKGDEVTNDTTAIEAADVYAASTTYQPVVYFPPGGYLITATTKTAKWVSDNPTLGTKLIWGGADNGGLAIDCTGENGSFGGFRNIRFAADTNEPTNWLDLPALIDKFYEMRNVHIASCKGDAITMYTWVNCHWYDIRFDNIEGYIIQATPITSQNLSTFTISGFTYDHSTVSSTCEGMIQIDNSVGNAANLGPFLIEKGRIEVNTAWAGKQAIFTYTQAASPSSSRSLQMKLSDVTYQDSSSMANDCALYRDTTNTVSQDTLILDNFSADGLSTILGGTWAATQYKPATQANPMTMNINAGGQTLVNYSIAIRNPLATTAIFTAGYATQAYDNFTILADGTHNWGNGNGATDTTLKRYGAGSLRCATGKFLADSGIGVGNSAAATTPGSVTDKMEVFDELGVSLGFVAIYDAIT